MENTEFTDRLKLFIKSKRLGQTKFEELVGLSRGYISRVKPSIGVDKLLGIIEVFPDLNLDWLITGKGEMIDPSALSDLTEQTIGMVEEGDIEYKNKYLEMLEENRSLRIEIEKLRKIIETKVHE
ncbi:helix-turn-helix domain-containing protein [Proteiniphilum acetatigenes]|uniref:helix-turn-helix domain-containing protein n=1 Tax=Proteiniphilum acetatigenes TaxID=294710 RepID=UPI00037006A4|nr:helix-turn-helix transcriptional regulator [Proteiniphilum acetatigenes]